MRSTAKSMASACSVRRHVVERMVAAVLFTLAAVLAAGAVHAQAAPCPALSQRDTSLRESIALTRTGSIGYYRYGHGQPLLLITGYRATVSEWNSTFLDALAAHRQIIVMDNPDVGRSQFGTVPDTMAGMADAVSGFIDTMHLGKVDVVGWSMGGMVAQQLALSHPQQVRSLVLISTTPPGPEAIPVSGTVNMILSGQSPSPFEAIMGVLFPPDARAQAIRCFRNEMFVPADYGRVSVDTRVANAQSSAMSTWWHDGDAAAALRRVVDPTLIVVGDQDDVLAPRNAHVLARLVPRATLHVVSGGGHALMYQDPSGLARVIIRFVGARG